MNKSIISTEYILVFYQVAVKIIDKTQLNSSSLQKVGLSLSSSYRHRIQTLVLLIPFLRSHFKLTLLLLSLSLPLPLPLSPALSFWSGLVFRESFNYRKQAAITSFDGGRVGSVHLHAHSLTTYTCLQNTHTCASTTDIRHKTHYTHNKKM